MKKPFLIILNGPAGGGKSTISKKLWIQTPRTALIQLDDIKWLISDYKSDSFDLSLSSKIGLKMMQEYLNSGINVIIEKAYCQKKYILPLLDYARKKQYPIFVYNIEAPWKIIEKRIKSRQHKMTLKKAKMIYINYTDNIFEVDKTFDTSKLSVLETVNIIKKDIKKIK